MLYNETFFRLAEPEPSESERQASEVRRADRSVFVQELLLSSLSNNLRLDSPLTLPSTAQIDADLLAGVVPAPPARQPTSRHSDSVPSNSVARDTSDTASNDAKVMTEKLEKQSEDVPVSGSETEVRENLTQARVTPVSAAARSLRAEPPAVQAATPVVYVREAPPSAPRAPTTSREEVLRNKMRAMEEAGSHERAAVSASAACKH